MSNTQKEIYFELKSLKAEDVVLALEEIKKFKNNKNIWLTKCFIQHPYAFDGKYQIVVSYDNVTKSEKMDRQDYLNYAKEKYISKPVQDYIDINGLVRFAQIYNNDNVVENISNIELLLTKLIDLLNSNYKNMNVLDLSYVDSANDDALKQPRFRIYVSEKNIG